MKRWRIVHGWQGTLVRMKIEDVPAGFHIDSARIEAVLADNSCTGAWLSVEGLRKLRRDVTATIRALEERRASLDS